MKLILIAALTRRRVIGSNGKLPWHIPEDLQRFKRLTTGHTVLMGRTTFESIGKPLPHRRNVVLTSRPIPGIECYRSLEAALEQLRTEERVFVIGGGKVYTQTLDRADELMLTIVEKDVAGDTYFPAYEHLIGPAFTLTTREAHVGFVFEDYRRI